MKINKDVILDNLKDIDSSMVKIWFENNGGYSKTDERAPVLCNGVVVGIISNVYANEVECKIWDKYVVIERGTLFEGQYISSIGLKTDKQERLEGLNPVIKFQNGSVVESIGAKLTSERSERGRNIFTPYGKLQSMTYLQKFKWLYPEIWDNLYAYQKIFAIVCFKGYDFADSMRRRFISSVVDKAVKESLDVE